MALLSLRGLKKGFVQPDGVRVTVLHVEAFDLEAGEQVALAGPSGSGKTTFLHLVAGLLRADAGSIVVDGTDLALRSEAQRDRFRAENLGYVFQSLHLLDGYSALENVLLGMLFGPGPDPAFARALLTELGLADRLRHRPPQLSVGQRQRVAIARALANRPRLVLADEPTGSLDAASAAESLALLRRACREHGAALLLVSHDEAVLSSFERRLDLAELNRASSARGGAA